MVARWNAIRRCLIRIKRQFHFVGVNNLNCRPRGLKDLSLTAIEVIISNRQIYVTKTSETAETPVSLFRGIHKHIIFIRAHERL